MLRLCPRPALATILVFFLGGALAAAASTPPPAALTTGESRRGAPVDEEPGQRDARDDPRRVRAAQIRALIEGSLPPEVEVTPLFVLDLGDPVLIGPGGERLLELLRRLEEPVVEPPRRSRRTGRRSAPEPTSEAEPDPAEVLIEAYRDFLGRSPEQRAALFAAHAQRRADALAEHEADTRRRVQTLALRRQADALEAFLAGTLALEIDPSSLLTLDLADLGEAGLSSARRTAWIAENSADVLVDPEAPRAKSPPTATSNARSVAREPPGGPSASAPEPAQASPTPIGADEPPSQPDPGAHARESATEAGVDAQPDPNPAQGPALGSLEALTAAQQRLDRLRRRFLALPGPERDERFEIHARRRLEAKALAEATAARQAAEQSAAAAEDEEIELLDAADVQEIDQAEQTAIEAAAAREQALENARQAQTEAKRILAEEHARLLGIKQAQALYEAELNRRKTELARSHERTLEWSRRVGELERTLLVPPEKAADADALYEEIRAELTAMRTLLRDELRNIRESGSQIPMVGQGLDRDLPADVERGEIPALRQELEHNEGELARLEKEIGWELAQGLRDDAVSLNRTRLTLLELASAELRDEVTGFGTPGIEQVERELEQISLELGFHALKLPRYKDILLERLRRSPLPVLIGLVQLSLIVLVFVWWRRRARALFERTHGWLDRRRPATRLTALAAAGVWYGDRIRKPLTMLLMLWFVLELVGDIDDLPELVLLWIVLRWVLLGSAAILMFDAIAARQARFSWREHSTAKLRFHSLRIIGLDVVAVGLVLSVTSAIVGQGAIYRWVISTCWILSVPVALYLVHRWRPIIFTRLERVGEGKPFVAWALKRKDSRLGHLAATAGALYLLGRGLGRWSAQQLAELETTRRLLAYLFRREVTRQAAAKAEQATLDRVRPLTPEHRGAFDPEDQEAVPYASVAEDELERVAQLVVASRSTLSAIVAERGSGKTCFLRRLRDRLGAQRVHVLSCPEVGFDGLLPQIAGITGDPLRRGPALVTALRELGPVIIAIDDAQRLVQPAVRGLRDLDRFTAFVREVGAPTSWVIAIGSAAWHYIRRARGDRMFFEQVVTLPRWTEEQLGVLIRDRCRAAALEPSFQGLVVPRTTADPSPGEGDRTESDYYRLLWDYSRGNPAVAVHAFGQSLFVRPDQSVVVRLFQEPRAKEVEDLSLTLLFVLRAIVQLELARETELVAATHLPPTDVSEALHFCTTRGYIEPYEVGYRLSWTWYRTITTVLQRQHLLSTL